MKSDIVLTIVPHPGNDLHYMACAAPEWRDCYIPEVLDDVPEVWLDLIPYLAARVLLSRGYAAGRGFIVRLQGSDRDMMRAPLGAEAATPKANSSSPVKRAAHCVFGEARK